MATHHHYLIDLATYNRIRKNIGAAPRCRACREKIRVDEKVVSAQKVGGRSSYYIYHEKCYRKLLIES